MINPGHDLFPGKNYLLKEKVFRHIRRIIIFYFGLLYLTVLNLPAQSPAMRLYDMSDGLKFNQIFSVFQDSSGFIWAGTSYGLSRYDGGEFITLTTVDGLAHNTILEIGEDDQRVLWILTQEGLTFVNPLDNEDGRCKVIDPDERIKPLLNESIVSLSGSGKSLWLITGRGRIYRWWQKKLELISFLVLEDKPHLCPLSDFEVLVTTDSAAWIAGNNLLDNLADRIKFKKIFGSINTFSGALLIADNQVWQFEGLNISKKNQWQLPANIENAKVFGNDETLIFLMSQQVAVCRKNYSPFLLTRKNGLPDRQINQALIDRKGIIWIATDHGLIKLIDLEIKNWKSNDKNLGGMIFCFKRDSAGRLWVGHSAGLSFLDENDQLVYILSSAESDGVWDVLPLNRETVLLATRSGLGVYRNNRVYLFPKEKFFNHRLFSLFRDRSGWIWAAGIDGLARFKWDPSSLTPKQVEIVSSKADNVLQQPQIEGRAITEAADGSIWAGTDGQGVLRYKDGILRQFGKEDGLPTLVCRAISSFRGEIWIGTEKGLYYFDRGKFIAAEKINRLLTDSYVVALNCNQSGLWVANPDEILLVNGQKEVELKLSRYNGLAGASLTAEHSLLAEEHQIAVGMVNGFSLIDGDWKRFAAYFPAVKIITVNGAENKNIFASKKLFFPGNSINFGFFSDTYLWDDQLCFSYRLLNLNNQWSEPRRSWSVQYNNLLPGKYTFQVRAVAPNGVVSRASDSFSFQVGIKWNLVTFGSLGLIVLITGLSYFFTTFRLRRIRQRNVLLEKLVSKRTSELAAANEELARLAVIDSLTGLANRRSFDSYLRKEWQLARREKKKISFLMIDIDYFKKYNDALGHQQGDECLKKVAHLIRQAVSRPADFAARYGGEEFAIILPHTDEYGARAVAFQIQELLASQAIIHPASPLSGYVTLSIGSATLIPKLKDDCQKIVTLADQALYQAKKNGRNRYVACIG